MLLDDSDFKDIQRMARSQKMTVAEWVRQCIRAARRTEPSGDVKRKLEVVRAATKHSFPTGDIDQMLAEIEKGYGAGDTA